MANADKRSLAPANLALTSRNSAVKLREIADCHSGDSLNYDAPLKNALKKCSKNRRTKHRDRHDCCYSNCGLIGLCGLTLISG
jgi:hypothetical protein